MKRVNQIYQSKIWIKDALFILLETKSFEDITLTEIAIKAGVTRMTIYRHFKTKEDILIFSFEELFKRALTSLQTEEKPTLFDILKIRLELLKDSNEAQILFKNNQFSKLLYSTRINYINQIQKLVNTKLDKYLLYFILGGINEMTVYWYQSGMKVSIEDIAKQMNAYILRLLT